MEQHQTDRKIVSVSDLATVANSLRDVGKKLVLCHGVFDLMHPGHIRHLEAASRFGDVLAVTVTPDHYVNKGPGRPVFNQRLRASSLAALQCVDYVAVNEWPTATQAIRTIKPDFYAKGSDYADRSRDLTGKIYEEEEAIASVGGKMVFTDEVAFSSTKLLNTFFGVYPEATRLFLESFRARFSADDIIRQLQELRGMKVLVIGDAIIDEYHYTQDIGKASKDPVITTRFVSAESFAGGAFAVANHVAGFCDRVDLVTCLGARESREDFVRGALKPSIVPHFFHRKDSPTIVKRRFVAPNFFTKLFEVCYLPSDDIAEDVRREVETHLAAVLGDYDVVIVSDFGHGFLVGEIPDLLAAKSRCLALNTQTNSANLGFNHITRYRKADYICINEPEIRYATRDRNGNLEDLTGRIAEQMHCRRIITTCGPRGCLVYQGKDGYDQIPALSTHVIDRIGASDSFFAVTSPCVAKGMAMDVVGLIGNAVAGLKVGIVGNRSAVEPVQLYKFIHALLAS